MIENAKNSLEKILREKAYNEVSEMLQKQNIDIESISKEDLEMLINEKVKIMQSELKGVGIGVGLSILVSIFGF